MSKSRFPGGLITSSPILPTNTSANGVFDGREQFQYSATSSGIAQWPGEDYEISRSLRFRNISSGYLSRTFGTATNNKIFTFSAWVKRSDLAASGNTPLMCVAVNGQSYQDISFNSGNTLRMYHVVSNVDQFYIATSAVFRDMSAWYHIVATYDSTQANSSNRLALYVNGVKQICGTPTYPSLNLVGYFNTAVQHDIGRNNGGPYYLDGYLTEVNFIDGQSLDPSYFGYTDQSTNIWMPKAYSGTYGTNGFYLPFNDPTSTTTIGYDFSSAYSQNLRSSGTNTGTFTANGGLASAFDGNTNQANAASAKATSPSAGYNTAVIGKDWGVSVTKTIAAVRLFAQNDGGFVGGTTNALTFKLQGSNDNSAWTDLTSAITGPATGAGTVISVTSGITTTTAYRYHRVNVNANGADNYYMCELEFYEAGIYGFNNWTASAGISVTAGVTYDSMVDVPVNAFTTATDVGGVVRGNYCVLNGNDKSFSDTGTLSNAGLTVNSSSATRVDYGGYGSIPISTGKWYFELTCTTRTLDYPFFGLRDVADDRAKSAYAGQPGNTGYTNGVCVDPRGSIYRNGTSAASGITWPTNGDLMQIAVDLDAKLFWVGKSNTYHSGSPSAGTGGASFTGTTFVPCVGVGDGGNGSINFGQRPFVNTPPTGFKSLNTTNLQAIGTTSVGLAGLQANKHFEATVYTGIDKKQSINNAGGFQPDFIWAKSLTNAYAHNLIDSVRGRQGILQSSSTSAETTSPAVNDLVSFDSTGFTVGPSNQVSSVSNGGSTIAWQWKGGGAAVSNTSGTVTSQVSVNVNAGFSIATWTHSTSANYTFGHGLGVIPAMTIVMQRENGGANHDVWHQSFAYTSKLRLNATSATAASYMSATPSSSVLSISSGWFASNSALVAYCWAAVPGYSAFGSYTGNGSADGPFVYCGFRPRWIMVKNASAAGTPWDILDTSRSAYNLSVASLFPDQALAEDTGTNFNADFTANGFKIRTTAGTSNGSTNTIIYAAFAETPFALNNRAR